MWQNLDFFEKVYSVKNAFNLDIVEFLQMGVSEQTITYDEIAKDVTGVENPEGTVKHIFIFVVAQ